MRHSDAYYVQVNLICAVVEHGGGTLLERPRATAEERRPELSGWRIIFSSISARSLRGARGRSMRVCALTGSTIPRWRVLAVLHEHSGATMGRLADLTSVDRTTLTRTLGLMERRLIARRAAGERPPQPRDLAHGQRSTRVRAHPAARACGNRAGARRLHAEADRRPARTRLRRMADNLKMRPMTCHQRRAAETPDMDYDRAYANGPFIPDADGFPPRWARDAAEFRAALGQRARTDIAYGPKPRKSSTCSCRKPRRWAFSSFIHGGYWLKFGRERWSHLAAGALARGWACAIPSYTLAPEARIRTMTPGDVRALSRSPLVWSRVRSSSRAIPPAAISARVWAAPTSRSSASLSSASCRSRRSPTSSRFAHRDERDLRLDAEEIAAESPARLKLRAGVEAHVWVGAQERPAFLWQARLLSEAWSCPWTPESGRHHFDVIDGLTDPNSGLVSACLD